MGENEAEDLQRRRLVAQALRAFDLRQTEAGELLAGLSTSTRIDTAEVFEDEVLLDGETFSGPMVWHVALSFPEPDADALVTSETLPGVFRGHFDGDEAIFDELDVDLSSLAPQPQP
jgi:hypothetical protein